MTGLYAKSYRWGKGSAAGISNMREQATSKKKCMTWTQCKAMEIWGFYFLGHIWYIEKHAKSDQEITILISKTMPANTGKHKICYKVQSKLVNNKTFTQVWLCMPVHCFAWVSKHQLPVIF